MNLVGYLIKHKNGGLIGELGHAYDYIVAGDGLYIRAETPHISAKIRIAEAEVRGLMFSAPDFVMQHGRIPQMYFDLAMSVLLGDPGVERYAAIAWESGWRLVYPNQQSRPGAVEYENPSGVVFEMHSHPGGLSEFSGKDDLDETGCHVYAVASGLSRALPAINIRVGVYGYFQRLKWSDVFEGALSGAVEEELK